MEISDSCLMRNRDWDPSYLSEVIGLDFFDFDDLWHNGAEVDDKDLVQNVEKLEKYCPIVEDISLEDEVLCSEVEKIEEE